MKHFGSIPFYRSRLGKLEGKLEKTVTTNTVNEFGDDFDHMCRELSINRDNCDFDHVMSSMREIYGSKCVQVQYPVSTGASFRSMHASCPPY